MSSRAGNVSMTHTNFVLVGIVELEPFRYLFAFLALLIYITSISVSSIIIFVTWMEESLHKPMYIFICSLVLNVMCGSSIYLPKLVIDLLSKSSSISLSRCLSQAFFTQSYICAEILTFPAMAYDRYLAISYPLRYPFLMTNLTSKKILSAIWIFVLVCISVVVWLTERLTFCGVNINNVFCETMSLYRLACGDISINNIYGTTYTFFLVISSLLVVTYCYIKTGIICVKHSMEASHKAFHTLLTHALAYTNFMVGALFLAFRYRINSGSISTIAHVAISMSCITTSVTINPLIYGIRTEALRKRIVHHLKNIFFKSTKI